MLARDDQLLERSAGDRAELLGVLQSLGVGAIPDPQFARREQRDTLDQCRPAAEARCDVASHVVAHRAETDKGDDLAVGVGVGVSHRPGLRPAAFRGWLAQVKSIRNVISR